MSGSFALLNAKLRFALAQLVYLPRTLGLVWAAARGWAVAWAILLLVQGLLPVAVVYLTRLLVDGLVAAAGAGGSWGALA
jgi:ATP-binding cassette subfamily B protein